MHTDRKISVNHDNAYHVFSNRLNCRLLRHRKLKVQGCDSIPCYERRNFNTAGDDSDRVVQSHYIYGSWGLRV